LNGNLILDQTLPAYWGSANHSAWGDYDGDGDIDLVLPLEDGRGHYGIYVNRGDGSFVSSAPPYLARDLEWSGVAWADADNDGYLDLTLTGALWPGNTTRIYRNSDGQGNLLNDIGQQLQGLYSEGGRSIGWADIDGDGDLDLAIAGHERNTENEHAIIYRNSASDTVPNSQPTLPSNLTAEVPVDTAYFSWAAGSDAETPAPSLTYNMRVGITPGGHEILSGVIPPGFGNTWYGLTHFLKNLPNGTHYWSVQTVDAGFARSEWAPEETFTINVTQRFTYSGQQLGVQNSKVAIGDLDNDGDLDIAVGIAEDVDNANRVYLNDGTGSFSDSGQMLGSSYTNDVLLVDVDNNGDLDIVSGNPQGKSSRIYINDGNAGFNNSGQSLPNTSQVAWSDFNLDGAPDLVFAGSPVQLFWNNGSGQFTGSEQVLGNAVYVACSDVTGDAAPDLIADGIVYFNDGIGNLSDSGQSLTPGSLALADVDANGYLDLFIGINDNSKIYLNDGAGHLADSGNTFGVFDMVTPAFADVDNDGDWDLCIGTHGDNPIYLNDGIGVFTDSGESVDAGQTESLAFGDIDNDGDVNAVVGNWDGVRIYNNNTASSNPNNLPTPPTNLASVLDGSTVTLSWESHSDDETPDELLTYNLHVWSATKGHNILSGAIGASCGNVGHTLSYTLYNLPRDIYLWSVQTVDSNFARSAWASATHFGATTFTDVTDTAGIKGAGSGIALLDYDNDGDLDAYVVNSGPNFLYQNNSDGTFTEVAQSAGIDEPSGGGPRYVTTGDYDNDGNIDIFAGNDDQTGNSLQHLFHNNGDGTFTDVISQAGLDQRYDAGSVVWVDYDKDGWVDLYSAGRYPDSRRLYHNNGDGTFTEVTDSVGLQDGGCTVAFADIDNDGYSDFYAQNGVNPSLYLNNRDGTFTDIAVQAGISRGGTPSWGDFNNDGYVDLFIANDNAYSALYRNSGNNTFTDITTQVGVSTSPSGLAIFGDYNNDGYLDIFVMSHPSNFLYHNNGDGTFAEVASIAGVDGNGGYAVFGDYDGDGNLDLFLSQRLFRNNGNPNHWLQLKLIGTISNRSAIGTRVKLVAGGLEQYREVSGGNGFSQNIFALGFGLGSYTQADTIEVRWPSGITQTLTNIAANQVITVVEEGTKGNNVAVLSLDGDSDYVAINDAATLDLNNSLTIEAWIKLNGTSSFRGIVEKWNDNGSQRSYNFQVESGVLTFHASSTGDGWDTVTGSTLSIGQWYHVAVTYDSMEMQLYLDSVPDGNPVSHSGGILNSTARLTIGSKDNPGDWFDGLIDEVRIWNVVRTQAEIQATMSRPLTGGEAGLVAYYCFDELENLGVGDDGLTDDVRDGSGNGNHGDLVGDATLVQAAELPLPIELSMFSAISTDNAVTLKWRTESETNNLGFNIYRSEAKDGKYIKVNAKLIQGAGTNATPHDYSFTDDNLEFGQTYYYYIEDVAFAGGKGKSPILKITVGQESEVKVIDKSNITVRPRLKPIVIPTEFALLQNFPNPFNPETWIPYQLAENADVSINIYNVSGKLIKTLHLGQKEAGFYMIREKSAYWDGRNKSGERVASGVYFYQLKAGEFSAVRKLVIAK